MATGPAPREPLMPSRLAETVPTIVTPREIITREQVLPEPDPGAARPRAVGPASLVGQTFDDFELLAEVGRGGMGVVYKARQKSLDRMVALKVLAPEHFSNPVRLARFQAEARAAAGLGHPSIVSIYQVGESAVGHYFVMEYIDGHTLETILERKKVPIPWAVGILIRVAEAVHHAHGMGIIHRDLKPANIMIDRFGRPRVMDFGIAKVQGQPASLTQQGMVIGTPAYMAPEQAGERQDGVGPPSDVYALGAILYALLTGRPPYEEETALRTVFKVIGPEMPPSIMPLRPEVPAELEAICMKCLSKRAGDRYPSAQALADDLRRWRARPSPDERRKTRRLPNPGETVHGADPRLAAPAHQAADGAQRDVLEAMAAEQAALHRSRRPSRKAKPSGTAPVTLIADTTGQELQLFRPRTVIGRSSDCNIILRAADVSKHHCQILLEPDQVIVEDLDSVNGTFLNGQQIERAELLDGDQLRIVRYTFEVHLAATARSG